MAIDFKNVTKIIGPGGKEVSKITRTSDNVVLWQPNDSGMIITTDGKYNESTSVPIYAYTDYGKITFTHLYTSAAISGIKDWHQINYGGYQDGSGSWGAIQFNFDDITKFAGKTIHIDKIVKGSYRQQYIGVSYYITGDVLKVQRIQLEAGTNVSAENINWTIPTNVINKYQSSDRQGFIHLGAVVGATYYIKGLYVS